MRILLTFDNNYAPHAATVMESAVRNCPQKFGFAIIHYDISQETQDTLTRHFAGRTKGVEFYKMDKSVLLDIIQGVKTYCWGLPTWLRLFAPVLLSKSERHIIYLDCDNILKIVDDADLTKPMCAATHYNPAYKWRIEDYFAFDNLYAIDAFFWRAYKNLGMNDDASYFNTGVMIINLEHWRRHSIGEQLIAFVQEHPQKIYFVDQDVLNRVINGNYCDLHPRWNAGMCNFGNIITNYPTQWLDDALKNPAIIHAKGWMYRLLPIYAGGIENTENYLPILN